MRPIKNSARRNDEFRMTNDEWEQLRVDEDPTKSDHGHKYDLEERTAAFSERVIDFALGVERNPVTLPLIRQLVRAATSIGANYCEADDAESKKDFRHKIGLCRKEARETKYWFRMVVRAAPRQKEPARPLWQEAKELHLIFSKIRRSSE
jgi:four helix bundle protein